MPQAVEVNVLLERGCPQDAVVKELTQRGLRVDRVLDLLNVVSGNVPPEKLEALSHVAGVRAVELDHIVSTSVDASREDHPS